MKPGLYYFGARYLDPRTSRWLSADPAASQGDYFPCAPVDGDARKRNENLPGMGGVFNVVNLHVYHYAENNPVKYTDPDGRHSVWEVDEETKTINITIPVKFAKGTTDEQKEMFSNAAAEWAGEYDINGESYSVKVDVKEVPGRRYRGAKVNNITFSSRQRDDNSGAIPNVKGSSRMTLYQDLSPRLSRTVKHEIGHLFGLADRYYEKKDSEGNRFTPSHDSWGSNIMAGSWGAVEGRNFEEGLQKRRINRQY